MLHNLGDDLTHEILEDLVKLRRLLEAVGEGLFKVAWLSRRHYVDGLDVSWCCESTMIAIGDDVFIRGEIGMIALR